MVKPFSLIMTWRYVWFAGSCAYTKRTFLSVWYHGGDSHHGGWVWLLVPFSFFSVVSVQQQMGHVRLISHSTVGSTQGNIYLSRFKGTLGHATLSTQLFPSKISLKGAPVWSQCLCTLKSLKISHVLNVTNVLQIYCLKEKTVRTSRSLNYYT